MQPPGAATAASRCSSSQEVEDSEGEGRRREYRCTAGMECLRPTYRRVKTVQRLALFMSLLFFYLPQIRAQNAATDAHTLLQFKQQLADPSALSSWDINSLDAKGCPKNWDGVKCSDQGSVISVVLEDLALQGELKKGTLGNLNHLSCLSLSNNALGGYLPDDLGSLLSLTYMNLSDNLFEGLIPSGLMKLPALGNLSLAGNQLSGRIPVEIVHSLNELDLSRNVLSGPLPGSLTGLVNLVALNLSMNQLDGGIPGGFGNLLLLETLDFRGNLLTGSIDPALLTLNKTRFVDLSSNQFTGPLPWQQSSNLGFGFNTVEYVNLSYNQLSGSLSDFGAIFATSLQTLDISNNRLYGGLPNLGYLPFLAVLRLSNNSVSGSVPLNLLTGSSYHLKELDLSRNLLTGTLEPISSSLLVTLNLSNNRLSGNLPSLLGSCEYLDLSNNQFSGDLSILQNWEQALRSLDLSGNNLTGPLPDNVAQFYQLNYLNISHNSLYGSLPVGFASSSRVLSTLDLSFNEFSGDIPESVFYYPGVTDLLLSHNQFGGSIPLSDSSVSPSTPSPSLISSPSHQSQVLVDSLPISPLQIVDLSSNNINGPIPGKIGSLSTLVILNLSFNSLSGPIPPQLSELNLLYDLDLSNNDLSGPIPSQLPASLVELNLSRNNLSGSVPKNLQRFPRTSFFPGNSGLQLPSTPSASPRTLPRGGRKRHQGMKEAAKAGLIAGCAAGAALIVALGIFIYYKSSSKTHDTAAGSEFSGSQKGFERCEKTGTDVRPAQDGGPDHGAPGTAVPVVVARSVGNRKGRGSPTENGSPEVKLEIDGADGDISTDRNHRLPCVVEDVMSPEHPLVSKVSPEHPIDIKVSSPDQLVGDVFFLDKTLSFSLEDLSRASAEVLGRSGHGTSYKATLDNDHILVVKWLKEGLVKNKKEFGVEAKKFGNIKHPNIVAVKGYYWGPREHEKLILSQYITGGSLADRLFGNTCVRPSLTWVQRLKIAVDISRGLIYLHSHNWAHGNIKASNVLVTDDAHFRAYLSDYSLHRLMTPAGIANQLLNSGALGYSPPELTSAKKLKPSAKSDVFSLGVILMELVTGKSAGDIISGNTGVVDLPDWVKLVANEGHAIDCYDTALVGVDRDLEPPRGIEVMLAVSLNCAAPTSSRPSVRVVYEELNAINPG